MIEFIWEYFRDERFLFPLIFTAKVTAVTTLLQLVLGVWLGRYLSQKSSPLRSAVDLAITLPLVFPPIALGFLLLLILGKGGPVGSFLSQYLGIRIIFTVWGVILASLIAGLPLIVKPVQSAIQETAFSLMEASYTLGKSEWQTFFHVVLPSIRKSIISGLSLAFGRSLGEVGLTLMLGGNIVGKTNTLSLEIYNAAFSGEFDRAIALSTVLGLISAVVFISFKKSST
ncbi:MAG: molybdate ABC transporter permease subunit [Desulfobacterales bacterium]|jgi:molybdate transport system permease protein|nr:molybdate ABC transporter permease subunit [Desulfobacterales bacterium]